MSDDGVRWHPLVAKPRFSADWSRFTVDLAWEADIANMTLGPNTRLKLQQYGSTGGSNEQRGFDALVITTPAAASDYYRLNLTQGQTVTFVLRSLTGGRLDLQLLDATGAPLAGGIRQFEDVEQSIYDFPVPATGPYYLRVDSPEGGNYTLVTTRNATVEIEPNDSVGSGQDISATRTVLGLVLDRQGARSSDHYRFAVNQGDVLNLHIGTIAEGPYAFDRPLFPGIVELKLYDARDVLVATRQFDFPYSAQAPLVHVAQQSGDYTAYLSNPKGLAYVLRVEGATGSVSRSLDFKAADPPGGLVHEATATGAVNHYNDTATYTVELDAGQTLTIAATPDADLAPRVMLINPAGAVVASSLSVARGQTALVQNAAVTGAGTYQVVVATDGASNGRFDLRVVLNAAVDDEALGGPLHDGLSAALDITDSFTSLGGALQRGAVRGRLLGSGRVVASEDFQSKRFGPEWSIESSGVAPAAPTYFAASELGDYTLFMDGGAGTNDFQLTTATWTVDLSGLANAY